MKRALMALSGILVTAGLCWAQAIEQTGLVRQELQTGGMMAFHPSLPIGSRAMVTNMATGEEIEVTIIRPPGAAPLPPGWVIDLSPVAAAALNVVGGETVFVTNRGPVPVVPQPPVAAAEPAPAMPAAVPEPPPPVFFAAPEPAPLPPVAAVPPPPAAAAEPVVVTVNPVPPPEPLQPVNIIIHNYIVVPDHPPGPPPVERRERPVRHGRGAERERPVAAEEPPPPIVLEQAPLPEPEAEEIAAAPLEEPAVPPAPPPPPPIQPPSSVQPPQPVQPPPAVAVDPAPAPAGNGAPINGVVIIPGLPDPHSNMTYRLQVGAFSGAGSAAFAVRQVEAAGFNVEQERHEYRDLIRVFAVVSARDVQPAIQRLYAWNFTEIVVLPHVPR